MIDLYLKKLIMSNTNTYKGSCFCGKVKIEVVGDPVGAGYCHCESCRHWSAGPMSRFGLWKIENVQVVAGKNNLSAYNKTPGSTRKWCNVCGGHVLIEHPTLGLIDVPAAVIPDFPFQAGMHVNYKETVMSIKDGLPKFEDIPTEVGGSGKMIPE